MEIKINKKEDGTVVYKYDEIEREFNYDNLDCFIEEVYNKTDEINYDVEDGLEEYKALLEEIVLESRKQDYIDAIEAAKKSAQELETEEEQDT